MPACVTSVWPESWLMSIWTVYQKGPFLSHKEMLNELFLTTGNARSSKVWILEFMFLKLKKRQRSTFLLKLTTSVQNGSNPLTTGVHRFCTEMWGMVNFLTFHQAFPFGYESCLPLVTFLAFLCDLTKGPQCRLLLSQHVTLEFSSGSYIYFICYKWSW